MRSNFNPQGPRGPRRKGEIVGLGEYIISIHKALAGLDKEGTQIGGSLVISIHKALAGLDYCELEEYSFEAISIHKALAGLDCIMSQT
ncbi:Uncharacterised protein [Enterocloster clostridioformis]|uniref:Uncharacterized protein n=1 Tax=Enterocloster clostridioformis TaxID=1531 RepID=A0A174IF85_9FIRM|nr:Uncharacterised protein [Enterocloster clostridioformis]